MNVSERLDSDDVYISKLGIDEGNVQLALSIVIHNDLSWHARANGCKVPSNNPEFSSKQQVIASVTDVQEIIDFLDSCTVCGGNADTKYAALVAKRNGIFVDFSGIIIIAIV